uniref:Uncharacterized protein n=1 Tax=Anopheles albimanus TaxID=7167 RepID=A0A182F586_ANOAL
MEGSNGNDRDRIAKTVIIVVRTQRTGTFEQKTPFESRCPVLWSAYLISAGDRFEADVPPPGRPF